jgi:NADH-quinone oxidoreductase subunit D
MAVMRINVGPIHPGTHGVLRLVVDVDGDTIRDLEPHIGFLHRGVEKLCETRSYMMSPSYMERLDYVAPLAWDELYVAAVEKATGTEVPERAQYARMVLLEFQRIASHLLWLGTFCNDLGQMSTMFMWTSRERARVLELLEDVAGSRVFYVNMRLGGINSDLPPNFKERSHGLLDYLEERISRYPELLDSNPVFVESTRGIGVLPMAEAINYGVSGPVLRAAGVREDVRRSKPYYFYGKVRFNVPVGSRSDVYERYKVRYQEMLESIKIIRQALDLMPDSGKVKGIPVKLLGPDAKPDPVLVSRELPRGEGLVYMVPDKQKPYRISLRAPSFTNLGALSRMCRDCRFADLFSILGSLDAVLAEIDR